MNKPAHALAQDKTHQRVGGAGFVIGALLIAVGSLLLPRAADLSDVQAMQNAYAEQATLLQACALLLSFGFWAILIGTSGIYHGVTGRGATWARLGFYFHLVGVTLWTVGMSLDISYPAAIVNWLAAPTEDKALAYSVVAVLSPVGFGRGIFPLNLIVNWLAFGLIGLAMLRSDQHPRWLGGWGILVGLLGMTLGIAMTFTGREALIDLFVYLMMLTIGWWLSCGVWALRFPNSASSVSSMGSR